MNTREITLYATKDDTDKVDIKKIDTNATTWGELKPIVEEFYHGINSSLNLHLLETPLLNKFTDLSGNSNIEIINKKLLLL